MRIRVACSLLIGSMVLMSGCGWITLGTAVGAVAGAKVGERLDRSRPLAKGTDVGAAVSVRLSVPRDIAAVRADMGLVRYDLAALQGTPKDSILVRSVTQINGRITASRNDSLLLTVTEATGSRGRVSFGGKHSVLIARDPSVSVRVLNRNPSRSQGVFLGALTGMFIGTIFALWSFGREGT